MGVSEVSINPHLLRISVGERVGEEGGGEIERLKFLEEGNVKVGTEGWGNEILKL